MQKKSIILRCDYGRIKNLSYGHYSRLKILEKILSPKYKIIFLIKKNKFNLKKKNEYYFKNKNELKNILIKVNPFLIFVDLPYQDYNYKKIVSKNNSKIIVFDNHLKNFHCSDIYVNNFFLNSKELSIIKKNQKKYNFRSFLGIRYFLTNIKHIKNKKYKKIKNILITIGGSDPGNYLPSILKSLSKITQKNLTFYFVIGWGFKHNYLPKIKNVKFLMRPTEIKLNNLRKNCDLAISTPSLMMIENAFFNIPQIILGKSYFEIKNIKKIYRKKIIYNSDLKKIHLTINHILYNSKNFEKINKFSKNFIKEIIPNKFSEMLKVILNQ